MSTSSTTQLAPAFRLVRQLLAEKPRTFQQLLRDGLTQNSSAGPSKPILAAVTELVTGTPAKRSKAKKEVYSDAKENVVPDGHPFVSANFLKRRILPVLASQDLISKSASPSENNRLGKFLWSLPSEPESSVASASSSTSSSTTTLLPTWDRQAHWDRLLASEKPSLLAHEYALHRAALRAAKRAAAQDDPLKPTARRTEREIWAWEGRQEGITTNLERVHLNTRKANARPAKERLMAARNEKHAETMAGSILRNMQKRERGGPEAM